jgi:TPR repeat protein
MRDTEEAIIWHKTGNVLLVRLDCPITFDNFVELERWLAREEKRAEPEEDAEEASEEILYYREIQKYVIRHGYFEPLVETQGTDERFFTASMRVQKAGYLAGKPVNVVAALILKSLECYGESRKLSLEYLADFEKKSQSAEYQRVAAKFVSLEEASIAYQQGDYATALRVFRSRAEQGDAIAQRRLGIMYEKGESVPQNYGEAAKWYRKAADQGDAVAQALLGNNYRTGRGVPQNYGEAVQWYRKAADQGFAQAQTTLGAQYVNGQGVTRNYGEAVKWFRLAADQDEANGQAQLGVMYEKGKGVPQNYGEAAKWYRKAAGRGGAVGQLYLGLMYKNGRSVPQDDVLAYMWLSLSAKTGFQEAIENRDEMARRMNPAQIAEARKLAREWKPAK